MCKHPITFIYDNRQYVNYLGNCWSDYAGIDSDRDGIGDNPHKMDGCKDKYPLVEKFENYGIVGTEIMSMATHNTTVITPETSLLEKNRSALKSTPRTLEETGYLKERYRDLN